MATPPPKDRPALMLFIMQAQAHRMRASDTVELLREHGGRVSNETFREYWNLALAAPGVFGMGGIKQAARVAAWEA